MIESLGWVRGAFLWGWCCWGRFCRVGSWKTTLGCHFVAVLVSMEMAPKGLYKISIPSKPIKIVHAISLQNDSPQPYFFAHFHHLSPRTPSTKWQPSQCINFCHLFTLWFWAGEKNQRHFVEKLLACGGTGTTKWQTWGVPKQTPLQNGKPAGCANNHLCHIYTFRIHCMVCFGPHFNQFLQAFSWPYFIILYFWVLLNTSSGFWWSTKCLDPAPPP